MIPRTKEQWRNHQARAASTGATPRDIQEATGKVVEVFDENFFKRGGQAPAEALAVMAMYPGELCFMIELPNGNQVPLLSDYTREEVMMTFGNRPLLLGRKVKIRYRGRVSDGSFIFHDYRERKKQDEAKRVNIADIGSVL